MPLKKEKKEKKLYYSIQEVAQMFSLKASTLRFWEDNFDMLRPQTNENGVRSYKKEDIETVRLIHHLLKVRKFTVAGASQQLKTNKGNIVRQAEITTSLEQIKAELLSLKAAFDAIEPAE
jgi:DNA-binding transcriptional MerR regulator